MHNLIICGYSGIGKSTLANNNTQYIDLESSCFAKTNPHWYIDYCKAAIDLSRKHMVLISAHLSVINHLKNEKVDFIIVIPDENLKEQWLDKLYNRYLLEPSPKNYIAYVDAKQRYSSNVIELSKENNCIVINSIDYSFEKLLCQIGKETRNE